MNSAVHPTLSESEFRGLAARVFARVENGFEEIDPDDAECEQSQGSISIVLPGGAKWIISLQPPVRQVWLAVASIGRAFHFDYDAAADLWRDDKGEGIELLSYLSTLLKEQAGLDVRF